MMADRKVISEAIAQLDTSARTPDRILSVIRGVLADEPHAIEELAPNHKLVKAKMTTAERTRLAAQAAAVRARELADERYTKVVPVIRQALEEGASLAQIKHRLDTAGIKPLRSQKWSRQAINYIIQREGLRNDGSE